MLQSQVDESVRTLADVTDPAQFPFEERLHADGVMILQRHAGELLADHSPDECAPPPPGEAVSPVDDHARHTDRRRPDESGRLQTRAPRFVGEHRAVVVDAVGHHRPTVVGSTQDQVEFVATTGAVLVRPDGPRERVDREPLHVPVAVAPDLGEGVVPADEGVVGGHAAVVVKPHDRPHVIAQVQRRVIGQSVRRHHPVAHRDIQEAIQTERHAAGEMVVVVAPCVGFEDLFHARHPVPFPASSNNRSRPFRPVVVGLAVAQIQPAILREVGVRENVHEAALALIAIDRGEARNRFGPQDTVSHHPKSSRPLHDQHLAAGQPRHRPGMVQLVRDRRHPEIVASRRVHMGRGIVNHSLFRRRRGRARAGQSGDPDGRSDHCTSHGNLLKRSAR